MQTVLYSIGRVLIFLRLWACRWINHWNLWHMDSVMPFTFQDAGCLCPVTGTKLYTRWHRHVCKQFAQGCYLKEKLPGFEPMTFWVSCPMPWPLHQAEPKTEGSKLKVPWPLHAPFGNIRIVTSWQKVNYPFGVICHLLASTWHVRTISKIL